MIVKASNDIHFVWKLSIVLFWLPISQGPRHLESTDQIRSDHYWLASNGVKGLSQKLITPAILCGYPHGQ